jgi:hypothetical protein
MKLLLIKTMKSTLIINSIDPMKRENDATFENMKYIEKRFVTC